ncbi:MAG: PEP/pyruvate-binding domain-containing protein [Anaerolineales bacterium]
MTASVKFFQSLSPDDLHLAGGKGAVLARLYRAGFPVPPGFIVLPNAFRGAQLDESAWAQARSCLNALREKGHVSFAVRSSAMQEDSSQVSFAGGFRSLIDVRSDEQIYQAILEVRRSSSSERVRVYSAARGLDPAQEMAVVVQALVASEISGVLFTADPLTGELSRMVGNFVHGQGEKLVSGDVDAQEFTIEKDSDLHDCPPELQPWIADLFVLGERLEQELGGPQDIEWAIAGGQLFVLQSRPITTLREMANRHDLWNDSLDGDFLWSNTNFGEAVSEVMTPLSWSVLRYVLEDWRFLPGFHPVGNICGRPYLNISVFASLLQALGRSRQQMLDELSGTLYMRLPENIEIPLIPLSKRDLAAAIALSVQERIREWSGVRRLASLLADNPGWCDDARKEIQAAQSNAELLGLWRRKIAPHVRDTVWSVLGSVSQLTNFTIRLRRELTELVGAEDSDTLLTSLGADDHLDDGAGLLASLGPVVGLAKVSKGSLSREAYLEAYGHRCQHEFELSVPRPAEDPVWLDQQLAQFERNRVDIEVMLKERSQVYEAAWARFCDRYPSKVKDMRRRIAQAGRLSLIREAARSEYTRDRWILRLFAVRAGKLTGLGDGIFYLLLGEVLDLLAGEATTSTQDISSRRDLIEQFKSLPSYPSIIRGRFEPFDWAADPDRRSDFYDAIALRMETIAREASGAVINGSPASAGRVQGCVRCLDRPEEGHQLLEGEILVTRQTNIAWMPLFPRLAAVVTDVGAPLSHAAIVARELGIPAVVGCGDATMRLKTGDSVIVDGGRGVVEILEKAA